MVALWSLTPLSVISWRSEETGVPGEATDLSQL